MNIDKKWVIVGIGIVVIVIAGYFAWRMYAKPELSPTQKVELELQKLIEKNLENWEGYQKTAEPQYKKFGNDKACAANIRGSEDFLGYVNQAQKGDVYKLDLVGGAYVIYTPNYNNWDAKKLASFGVNDMRVCSSGWLTPLYAYPDKVVWGNITCSGVEESQIETCSKINRIVMGYFVKKSQ